MQPEAKVLLQALLVAALTVPVQAQFAYEIHNGVEVAITRYQCSDPEATIPETIEGLPVTTILSRAFESCRALTRVTFPRSLTSIAGEAFWDCPGLIAFEVDAANPSFSSLDGVLFNRSQSRLVRYPLGKPGGYAIPSSVTNVWHHAFYSCVGLTEVVIPDTVTRIDYSAFHGCTSMTHVVIGEGVKSLGDMAFSSCLSLTRVTIPAGVANIPNNAFALCGLTNLVIPASVTSIGNGAFSGCSNLRDITIPASVTSIGSGALSGCSKLTEVVIPASVTNILGHTFSHCDSLTNVTILNGSTHIGQNAFAYCPQLRYARIGNTAMLLQPGPCAGSFTIPETIDGLPVTHLGDNLTLLGGGLFSTCTNLTNIFIPSSLSSVGSSAFQGCSSLIALEVDPANPVYSSRDGVLFDRSQATLISYPIGRVGAYTIPAGVTSIGSRAFAYCPDLTRTMIPNSVIRIEASAFVGCPRLSGVYCEGNAPSNGGGAFANTPATLYYLPGATGWGTTYDGRPTALWVRPEPTILTRDSRFGPQANGFAFVISWATNASVGVDASPTLATPSWSPVSTHTLVNGTAQFTDPDWTNHPSRFYRVRKR